jgi:hypothetical protein
MSDSSVQTDPLVPGDLSQWSAKIVDAVRRSWRPLPLILLPLSILDSLPGLFGDIHLNGIGAFVVTSNSLDDPTGWALSVGGSIVGLAAGALAVWAVVRQAAGQSAQLRDGLRFLAARIGPLLGWALVCIGLAAIGFLLILPGLFFTMVLNTTFFGVVLIERRDLRRAAMLVARRLLPTLGRCTVAVAVLVFAAIVATTVAVALPDQAAAQFVWSVIAEWPLSALSAAFAVVTYAELRWHEDPAVGTLQLAAELNR